MQIETAAALIEVTQERARQTRKWGEQNHDNERWLAILAEEFGEIAKEVVEGDEEQQLPELIQLAAVAVAWIECIDRRSRARAA